MVTPRNFNLGQLIVAFDGETAVIHGPARNSNGAETEIESSEEALRNWVRHDSAGRYRPLPGAANMRPDWRVRCSAARPLSTVLDIVYPLAMLHIEQRRAGTLDVVPLQSVLERQAPARDGRLDAEMLKALPVEAALERLLLALSVSLGLHALVSFCRFLPLMVEI